jgi:hypothetical protein
MNDISMFIGCLALAALGCVLIWVIDKREDRHAHNKKEEATKTK